MNKKFEILEHTADIKIRIFGESLEELFENALFAMAGIQDTKIQGYKDTNKFQIPNSKINRLVKVKSIDKEALLVDFLGEVLSLSDINDEIYPECDIIKLSDKEIEAEVKGLKVDQFDEDIKAVTYHGVKVEKTGDGWMAEVVFDI